MKETASIEKEIHSQQ